MYSAVALKINIHTFPFFHYILYSTLRIYGVVIGFMIENLFLNKKQRWIEPDLNLVDVVDCVVEFDWLTLRRGRLRAVDVAECLTDSLVSLDLGDRRGV